MGTDKLYITREIMKCPKCFKILTIKNKNETHTPFNRLIEMNWKCDDCGRWRQQRLYNKVGLVISDEIFAVVF